MTHVIKLGIKRPVTKPLLPDPEPRPVKYTLISADDHLMEPPHTFEGRLPSRLQGRAREDQRMEPARFEQIRPGCFDVHARIKDMDIGGIWGSVNFPSGVTGSGGHLFSQFAGQDRRRARRVDMAAGY